MIISYSPSTDPRRMLNFQRTDVRSLSEAQQYILKYAWSPCVWDGNIRAESRFLFSDFCALDFDDGKWSVADAIKMLNEKSLCGFVGTTKSHRLEKDGVIADRFRIVMPWASRITDLKVYKQNMARLVTHMPADQKAKDGARFFWPCTAVAHYRPGARLDWEALKSEPVRERILVSDKTIDARMVPEWLKTKLRQTLPGARNSNTYWAAMRLKERGFIASEAENVISQYINLDRTELARTVLSAFTRST